MNVREWALIAFTILAQMSVGSFLVFVVVHFYATRKEGIEEADRMGDRALLAIGPVMVLGLLASLFHLGSPLTAYRAVTNLGSSWLSREIFFGVLFAIFGGLFAIMQWRKISTAVVRNVIAWIAAIVGVVFIYSMSRVYILPIQPTWNTLATPLLFFTTTLLLGALTMGAAYVANYAYVERKEPDCADVQCGLMRDVIRWIAVASIILVGIELVVLPVYLSSLAASSDEAVLSASLFVSEYGIVFVVRLILAFIGAGIFGIFLYQNAQSPGRERVLGNLVYGAFALVLVAEVMGRFLFYATQVQIGM
ncbi:MAG: dimethyl sulfoxide reductase anchor subunit [Anaerolineales bacterium]|jgi:anaerobic dimethyl sulfoxide reductase subunit C (anchor subunit)